MFACGTSLVSLTAPASAHFCFYLVRSFVWDYLSLYHSYRFIIFFTVVSRVWNEQFTIWHQEHRFSPKKTLYENVFVFKFIILFVYNEISYSDRGNKVFQVFSKITIWKIDWHERKFCKIISEFDLDCMFWFKKIQWYELTRPAWVQFHLGLLSFQTKEMCHRLDLFGIILISNVDVWY